MAGGSSRRIVKLQTKQRGRPLGGKVVYTPKMAIPPPQQLISRMCDDKFLRSLAIEHNMTKRAAELHIGKPSRVGKGVLGFSKDQKVKFLNLIRNEQDSECALRLFWSATAFHEVT
jgi:hypothetical protein